MYCYKLMMKRVLLAVVCLLTVMTAFPIAAGAEVPYRTFTQDSFGRTIFSQPAYAPAKVVGRDIYIEDENGDELYSPLNKPQDLFIDQRDHIYIADTGNNRIVHFDENEELVQVITVPDSPLNQPSGLFVSEKGDIYVADSGNNRVIRLSQDGELLQEFSNPQSDLISDSFVFEPTNMVVDRRGFVYVVSRGTFQGVVQFDNEANFYGFYGTNSTEVSIMDRVRRIFYTEEQLSRQVRLLPTPIRSLDIDDNGFIYTVSGSNKEQIKKLNVRGENQWQDLSFGEEIGDRFVSSTASSEPVEAQLTDASVDENGNVTVVDKARNSVSQYDMNGNLLFLWTGRVSVGTPQMGINQSPVAVDTNSKNEIFILDDALNFAQVLEPTEFGTAVHQAYIMTRDGRYEESEQYWEYIVKLNAHFTPAYAGLARAAFYRENYEEALELYRLAGDAVGYSDAFWQVRLEWFQKNFAFMANTMVILAVGLLIGAKMRKRLKFSFRSSKKEKDERKRIWLLEQLKQAFVNLKHPLDGFTDLRFMNKGGYLSAFIILALVITIVLAKVFLTGFAFNPVPPGQVNVGSILSIGAVVWVSFVICHYLIGSIKQGEARFKDIFVGSSYALFPVVLLGLPLALFSNVMTLSELAIYEFFEFLMILWSAALFFWMIQALQNYRVGEAVVSILLTFFSMVMMWVLAFIIVGLSSETFNFLYTIYQEVTM